MTFQFIRDHREHFPVRLMCRVLEASPSGFYDWLRRPESQRAAEDRALIEKIQAVHNESRRTYGSPRVHASLKAAGYRIGRKRVARLMRENDIRPRTKRKFKVTTDSRHDHPIAPNLLDRQFTVEAPNTVWLADLSYIWTREGWLYLAVVIDLFARRVVGWATGDRPHRELALAALRKALTMRRPGPGLMHHSDSQYCSIDYQAELNKHGILVSMSGKGNCYDNAMVETFFKTLKSELVWRTVFYTRQQADQAIGRYIDGFYNPLRRHSALDFTSPAQFEKHAAE